MHGYKFKSKDLQEHFQKFKWYKGTKENVDNELTENEKRLIRIISATEAANPPTRDNIVGHWVYAVENGFLDYYINSDGTIEGFHVSGRWYLEGTLFRTLPDPDDQAWADWPLNWNEEVKNLQISFVEYEGKLYKRCNFFNSPLYEKGIPRGYWND